MRVVGADARQQCLDALTGALFIDVIEPVSLTDGPLGTIKSRYKAGGLPAQGRCQTRSRRFANPTERGMAAIAGSTSSILFTKATWSR